MQVYLKTDFRGPANGTPTMVILHMPVEYKLQCLDMISFCCVIVLWKYMNIVTFVIWVKGSG